jgi:two-component system, cell cycle sensor histidine kinase and response regulator CckA
MKDPSKASSDLRLQAESRLKKQGHIGPDPAQMSPDQINALIHELQTHQIELELQNEELRQAQELLTETQDRYTNLYDFAPVGYLSLSSKNLILEANLTAAGLFGIERNALIKMPLSRFVVERDQDIFYLMCRRLLETKRHQTCELDMKRENAPPFSARLEALVEERQAIARVGLRITISDITQRKRIEEDLRKNQNLESLGFIAGGIAHDFNNLLTGVVSAFDLLKLMFDQGSEEYELVEFGLQALDRTQHLSRQLLTFAKGGEPIKVLADIAPLIQQTTDFALSGSKTKPEYHLDQDLLSTQIDKGQISQVIHNLTLNAVQAMPAGGTLRLAAANITITDQLDLPLKEGDYVKVSVADQGVGMAPETIAKVFDPYFSTKAGGHGLGLSITHSIINKHGGYIEVSSQQDIGTTFNFYLPASPKKTAPVQKNDDGLAYGTGRILLMDDEEIIHIVMKKMLKELGYEVETVYDGDAALLAYKAALDDGTPYDATIVDLTVPGGMGGEKMVQKLHEIDPKARVIVSSGYSSDPIIAHYADYGFSGRLEKPLSIKILAATLKAVLTG